MEEASRTPIEWDDEDFGKQIKESNREFLPPSNVKSRSLVKDPQSILTQLGLMRLEMKFALQDSLSFAPNDCKRVESDFPLVKRLSLYMTNKSALGTSRQSEWKSGMRTKRGFTIGFSDRFPSEESVSMGLHQGVGSAPVGALVGPLEKVSVRKAAKEAKELKYQERPVLSIPRQFSIFPIPIPDQLPICRISDLRDVKSQEIGMGLATMRSTTARFPPAVSLHPSAQNPTGPIGPGEYDPALITSARKGKGQIEWQPTKNHRWECHRLDQLDPNALLPGPGSYNLDRSDHYNSKIKRPQVYKFPYGCSNFISYDQENRKDSGPGPGQYASGLQNANGPKMMMAPFASSSPRFPYASYHTHVERTAQADAGGSDPNDRKENAVHVTESKAIEFASMARAHRKESIRQRDSVCQTPPPAPEIPGMAKTSDSRFRFKQLRKMREDAQKLWIQTLFRTRICMVLESIQNMAQIFSALRRKHSAIRIQRYWRHFAFIRRVHRFRNLLHIPINRILMRLILKRKRKAAARIGSFLQDVQAIALQKQSRLKFGEPTTFNKLLRQFRDRVVKIQRFWRLYRIKQRAQLYVLATLWVKLQHKPQFASQLRSQQGGIFSAFAPRLGQRVRMGAGSSDQDESQNEAMDDICTLEDRSSGVSPEIKLKLLGSLLRELKTAHMKQIDEHERRMEAFISSSLNVDQIALDEARAELIGNQITTTSRRREELKNIFMQQHPKPVFPLFRGVSHAAMFLIIAKGFKEQVLMHSRQTIRGPKTGRNPVDDATQLEADERDKVLAVQVRSLLKKYFSKTEKFDRQAIKKVLARHERLFVKGTINIDEPCGSSHSSYLHTAVWFRQLDLVKWLLAWGASPNYANMKGNTPMHFACEHADKEGGLELLQWLCRAGGDVYVRNITEQLRAIDKAPVSHRKQITTMLLDAKEGMAHWPGYGDSEWGTKWRSSILKEWRSSTGIPEASHNDELLGEFESLLEEEENADE